MFKAALNPHSLFAATQILCILISLHMNCKSLSDMHWACRHGIINAIFYTYDSLLSVLEEILEGPDQLNVVEAQGLILQVKDLNF